MESTVKFASNFTSGSPRTARIKRNVALSFVLRSTQIVAGLLLVPLTLNYLDATGYGIWLTLSSIVGWFRLFDVGLGNGLRNRLAEALAKGDEQVARAYISTAYFSVLLVSAAGFLMFVGINCFLNWSSILNATAVANGDLRLLALYVFGFFFLRLVLQLLNSIFYAIQEPALNDLMGTIGQLLNLLLVFVLVKTTSNSLLYLGISYSVAPVFVIFLGSLLAFSYRLKNYRPSLGWFRRAYLKDILGLGGKFFLLQICGVVLYSTDNVIIAQIFSPKEVTPYQIANRYFGMVLMGFVVVVTPFWSAITEAFVKRDFAWIKRGMRKLVRLWYWAAALLVIMLLFSTDAFRVWVGNKVRIPFVLSLVWALFVAVQTMNAIFTNFINGTGFIKLQLYVALGAAVANIPLSIVLAKFTSLGVAGVIAATLATQVIALWLAYYQYKVIMTGGARGIWAA